MESPSPQRTLRRPVPAVLAVVLIVLAAAWWNSNRTKTRTGFPGEGENGTANVVKLRRMLMGTEFEVTIWSPREKSKLAHRALQDVFGELHAIEARISSWKSGSETAEINRAAGGEPVPLSAEMEHLLQRSLFWTRKTGGAFDVTGGPMFELWEDARERVALPEREEIERRRALTGIQHLQITGGKVRLEKPGMKLGFGAIGKGFAADQAAAFLESRGFPDFLINAGGDLLARGDRGHRPWQVAIRNPRRRDAFLGVLEAKDVAVATSGDYERFFAIGGKRYSHILDLRTGRPATHLSSSTVIARSATDADALATALFVMKTDEGLALVESLPGVEAVFVGENERLTLSSGVRLENGRLILNRG